ncbi:MAG: hypothetical protein KGY75_06105 [Candidatus Cloacimonetes bacterium]|nr:hypothetical protein [Candidatus Cloacimonadota bacterium]MBS3767673.1 hypothetical protein [Candidatus Cloacimonadota bacterium]
MAKGKTFAAKLAHEKAKKEKELCPVCGAEIKTIQVIKNNNKKGKWSPKKQIVQLCKCNEKEVLG